MVYYVVCLDVGVGHPMTLWDPWSDQYTYCNRRLPWDDASEQEKFGLRGTYIQDIKLFVYIIFVTNALNSIGINISMPV